MANLSREEGLRNAVVVQEFVPERSKGEPQDSCLLLPMVVISVKRERYMRARERRREKEAAACERGAVSEERQASEKIDHAFNLLRSPSFQYKPRVRVIGGCQFVVMDLRTYVF